MFVLGTTGTPPAMGAAPNSRGNEMPEDSSEVVREQSESVAATNLKTLGDGPAFYQNQAYAESLANTQAMNQLRMTLLGKISESVIATSPHEAAGSMAMAGILAKMMQSTPQETAGSGS